MRLLQSACVILLLLQLNNIYNEFVWTWARRVGEGLRSSLYHCRARLADTCGWVNLFDIPIPYSMRSLMCLPKLRQRLIGFHISRLTTAQGVDELPTVHPSMYLSMYVHYSSYLWMLTVRQFNSIQSINVFFKWPTWMSPQGPPTVPVEVYPLCGIWPQLWPILCWRAVKHQSINQSTRYVHCVMCSCMYSVSSSVVVVRVGIYRLS